MRIKKLIVRDLFGHFNHTIPFHHEQITIITAPNGYGKTIVLKIIDAIFNKNFSYLSLLEFTSIELVTSDGLLTISKDLDNGKSEDLLMTIDDIGTDSYRYCPSKMLRNMKRFPMHMIDARIPFLTRVGDREWMNDRTGELMGLDSIIENFHDLLPDRYREEDVPPWLTSFINSLQAHFIQDQRLILRRLEVKHSRQPNFIDTIEKYADELSERIRDSSNNSSKISQQLDTTFPERLLKQDYAFKPHTVDELKGQLNFLQKKREVLANYNLLSSDRHLPNMYIFDKITESDTKVLTLYVEDTKQKLEAYDNLLQKIELFSSILNNKRLSFKKITIDPEKGFIFVTDKGRPLKLTQLSSGEQHQVVLLYELVFKTQENVLVLIDEPEISLHVAWQKDFLDDLKKIIEIQNMVVVIATHSPQIINNNWNLVVDLEDGAYV